MLDVHVHGNCQSLVIAGMLGEVHPEWNITFYEVHADKIIEDFEKYKYRIKNSDVIITQPIHDGYRDTPELSTKWVKCNVKDGAKLITVAATHFAAHNPDLGHLDIPGLPSPFNLLAGHLVATGLDESDALETLLSESLLTVDEVQTEISLALAESHRRDRDDGLDVPIGPFLDCYCWQRPVCHIENHPLRPMMAHTVNGILRHLGLPEQISNEGRDYQPVPHFPPLPTISRHLLHWHDSTESQDQLRHVTTVGLEPQPQREFYKRVIRVLREFPPDIIFDGIARSHAAAQFLRRLANGPSQIRGIGRWA